MITRKKVLTAVQLQAEIDAWSDSDRDNEDDDDGARYADNVDICILPPEPHQGPSDTEDFDDNEQLVNDVDVLPREMAGGFEVEYVFDDENAHIGAVEADDNDDGDADSESDDEIPPPVARGRGRPAKGAPKRVPVAPNKTKWSSRNNYSFEKEPFDDSANLHKALYDEIGECY